MDRLENTVRGIYGGSDNIVSLGPENSPLPPEWESFFKRSAKGLRKQEPEVEKEEVEGKELLPKILEGLIARIEKNEARLELLEGTLEEEEGVPAGTLRKGTDPKISLLKMEMVGLCGELVRKRG